MASGRVPNTAITFFRFVTLLLPSTLIEARNSFARASKALSISMLVESRCLLSLDAHPEAGELYFAHQVSVLAPAASCTSFIPASLAIAVDS